MSINDDADEFSITPLGEARCDSCGQPIVYQSPQQTQLNATCFVSKRHPRIRLRGQLDSLHSLVLLAQHRGKSSGEEWICTQLGDLAAYCRELVSAEYNERPPESLALDGKDAAALHAASHNPGSLGVRHILPTETSSEIQHWLNVIRTKSREVELIAYDAFPPGDDGFGKDVVEALNIVSSAVYYLQLKHAAPKHSDRNAR